MGGVFTTSVLSITIVIRFLIKIVNLCIGGKHFANLLTFT